MIDRINDTGAEWIFILDEMYSLRKNLSESSVMIAIIYDRVPIHKIRIRKV